MHLVNLTDVLLWAAKNYPQNGLVFYSRGMIDGEGLDLTYSAFLRRVEENAFRIHALGVPSGTIFLLHFNNIRDNLEWFWAVTYAGFTPALSTPLSNNLEQRRKHLLNLKALLNNPVCLTHSVALGDFSEQNELRLQTVESLPYTTNKIADFYKQHGFHAHVNQGELKHSDDIAALMLTSGSTGLAKAVCLTHSNVIQAVMAKSTATKTNCYIPFFNWVGADHVANLTEIHIHAMCMGATQVHAEATEIVQDPLHFLRLMHKHRIGYTFAPNFFLASLRRAIESCELAELIQFDLSALRNIISGGEANVVETGAILSRLLQERGAWPNVIKPAFGMTETCAGSIYNSGFPEHDIERGTEFASLGACHSAMEMRIVDDEGKPVGVDVSGSLEVAGPAVFERYYNNPATTAESFSGRWFVTGDQGSIDAKGQLHLTGRAKETIIVNGVSYSPQEIESVLEHAGAKPSYTVVFPFRTPSSETESLAVAYCPTYDPNETEKRVQTNDALTKATMLHIGVMPLVIPLNATILQKTTLGKISRTKTRKAYEQGDFQPYLDFNNKEVAAYRAAHFEGPENETENMIFEVFKESFDIPEYSLGANANLFEMGVNSIDLIKIQKRIERRLNSEVSVMMIMTNPTMRSLAAALQQLKQPREYDPMIVLQSQGPKTPLWLIHPGVGEVLVFLGLASHFTDRPIYAMRARGFEKGEKFFSSIEEMVTTYVEKIKSVQPNGPYALAGYSYGSMVAFEMTKRLTNQNGGTEVKFLGIFNLPPYIKTRMRQLDWTNCILNLSYFLDFFSEQDALDMIPKLQGKSHQEILDHILRQAPKGRLRELGLDAPKLQNWANLAHALQSAAVDYEPSGVAECMDVFAAIPLASVARDVNDWMENHLKHWENYSKTEPRYHQVDGAHYTMLSSKHVLSFQKTLKIAMQARGV